MDLEIGLSGQAIFNEFQSQFNFYTITVCDYFDCFFSSMNNNIATAIENQLKPKVI